MLFIRKYKQLLKFNCNNFLVINYYRHYQVFKEQNLRNQMISQNQVKRVKRVALEELLAICSIPEVLIRLFFYFDNSIERR